MRWSLAPRIVALAAVALVGVYYIGVDVLGVGLFGRPPYTVLVVLPRAGGLYAQGDVTYRGVPVGKVEHLQLHLDDVVAQLGIDPGVRIPANTSAHVRELSALGEQYLDLVPNGADGPDLHAGSVIPEAKTTVPDPIGTVLGNVAALVKGINPRDIQTLEAVLYPGFTGTGPDLHTIITTGQSLAQALIAAAPATVQLIIDGNTVLQAALATNGDFAHFTSALDRLTKTFANANADIQALLVNGVTAENQINPLLTNNSTAIQQLVANLGSAGSVSLAYQPAVQALFAVLPVVSGELASVGTNGQIRGEVTLNTDHTVCPYIPAAQQTPPTQATGPANLDNTCHLSAPDLLQRGAQNAPMTALPETQP